MVLPFDTITQSAGETQTMGEDVGRAIVGGSLHRAAAKRGSALVLCLWGDLGSGKTTFVQGLAHGMGIDSRLLSPTFIIVRHYQLPTSETYLYHLDLYRIAGTHDMDGIGLSDMMHESGSIVVVEWPERLGALLPECRIDVRFEILDGTRRNIIGENHG